MKSRPWLAQIQRKIGTRARRQAMLSLMLAATLVAGVARGSGLVQAQDDAPTHTPVAVESTQTGTPNIVLIEPTHTPVVVDSMPASPPTIERVDPANVPNAATTNIVIYGQGFDQSAVVVLAGAGALSTSFISPSMLTAVVPAGLTPGSFELTVVLSSGASASRPGALNILGPTATPQPTAYVRPLLVIQSYGASSAALASNSDIDFELTLVNNGQSAATNIAATFVAGDLIPRATGGVRSVGALGPGEAARIFQPFTVGSLSGKTVAVLELQVSYFDANGQTYNDTFTLTFPVAAVPRGPVATSTPTPTPTATTQLMRPQLLINAYSTDIERLQPGARFSLQLSVQNMGSGIAERITLIAGGGSSSDGSDPGGTPDPRNPSVPGGVSGSAGDFTNFAPVDASNVQTLGDLAPGGRLSVQQTFVVNASTKAGAYPMKFSFVYAGQGGATYTDDQVITLLVYQPPMVDLNFYRETGPLFAGQPNLLPLQIINLGRNTAVLGNMRVQAENAELANNVILVGSLDSGGFFTLDATLIPHQPGPLELVVTVDYTDDFNQAQRITQSLVLEVLEAPILEPGDGGTDGGPIHPPPPADETTWQKVLRFVRGMLGLDGGPVLADGPGPGAGEGFPPPGEEQPFQPGGPGGKG